MNDEIRAKQIKFLSELCLPEIADFLTRRFPRAVEDADGTKFQDYFFLIQDILTIKNNPLEKIAGIEERLKIYGLPEILAR